MDTNPHRASLNKVADNLLAELVNNGTNWHTVKLIGQELVILSNVALEEQLKQRQNYIKSKYEES